MFRHDGVTFTLVVLVCALLSGAGARADDIDKIKKKIDSISDDASTLRTRYLGTSDFKGDRFVAERMVDGENFHRIKDYQRAAIIFMDIIENYPQHELYPNALFLYADSLFMQRDYVGAQQWFGKLVESRVRGGEKYRYKALERLVEIAIHLDQYEGVEPYVNELGNVAGDEASYTRGKFFYYQGSLEKAKNEFSRINGASLLGYKALYLMGVILTVEGKYKEAINIFLKGQTIQAKSKEEQEIIDLMNLGAGRLYFEQGFVQHASECYQRIAQTSHYFDAALYEAASVLIRAGYTVRAEQTLEVLTVALPDSKYIPRAKMLRGNLLLRTGRYADAEKVFDELITEFTPVMKQLDEIISEQADTRQFFYDLVERSKISLDINSVLPPLVVKWVGEEPDVKRALGVAEDLGKAKTYIKETEKLVRLLEAVIDGPSRVNAIPMLREAIRRAQQLENRLALLRTELSEIAQEKLGDGIAELGRLKQESESLRQQVGNLPTDDASSKAREKDSREVYDRMKQELARNMIRIDQLSAMIVAIERFITDPKYTKGLPQEDFAATQSELVNQQGAVEQMRAELLSIRNDVESASFQLGIGDSTDKNDEELKRRLRVLTERERELVKTRGGRLGARFDTVYDALEREERNLAIFKQEVESEAIKRTEKIKETVRAERDKIATYNIEIQSLSEEAEDVVGGVAFENFSSVRKRFQELVLKADVGIIDVAWLRKEEHTARVSELTKGRLNDIKVLDDQFQEVKEEK